MAIKQQGGIFGRNPTFNNITVDGSLTVDQIVEKTGASGITLDGVTLKDGNVVLSNGKGIDFSANSGTGTSELFDDYEEGTWTPVPADSSSGGNTGSVSFAQGEYTKVGNIVYLKGAVGNINTTGFSSGNDLFIQGLPFVAVSTSSNSFDVGSCLLNGSVTFSGFVNPSLPDNKSAFRFSETQSGSNIDHLTVSQIDSGASDVYFSLTYRAA